MINDELLHKWINKQLSEAELEDFKQRPEYPALVNLYQHTEDWESPHLNKSDMLQEILKTKKENSSPKVAIRRSLNWLKYAAAALALLLATWFFWPNANQVIQYKMAKGERTEGILPDQSSFVLNAESALSYDPASWEENRSLRLRGEAFFEVKKGARFEVATPTGMVTVLGTKFNVRARKKCLEVVCLSGKVAVSTPDGQLITELEKTEGIRICTGKPNEQFNVQGEEKASWVTGISKFKKVPLRVVLDELERQFDIQINTAGIATDEIISCNFPHQDLNLALQTSLQSLGIKYEINGKQVKLSK